ncbi:MAG: DUF2779 domain-containing protein [Planctomycetota bacterium]
MRISKSDYLIGRHCSRRLWLRKRSEEPEPATNSAAEWEMRRREGVAIEALVEGLIDAAEVGRERREFERRDPQLKDVDAREARTRRLIATRDVVFQAYLKTDALLAVADVLEPRDGGWYLWEVKASTKVTPLFDHDLAFQVEVARASGLEIVGAGIWLLDKTYVRQGDLEPERLMMAVDRSAEVAELGDSTRVEMARQHALVANDEIPMAAPGPRCKESRGNAAGDRPSTCGHLGRTGYCGAQLPMHWIGHLPEIYRPTAAPLLRREDQSIESLSLDDPELVLTTHQRHAILAVQTGEPWIGVDGLRSELGKMRWPRTYVDFEYDTGMGIPRHDGSWAYATMPFQWSIHIQREAGAELEQPEPFLWLSEEDPRRAFTDSLLAAIPKVGSVIVHYRNAESTVLSQLSAFLGADYVARIEAIQARLYDTIDLLKAGYLHADQQGSFSIKKAAPAILGHGYEGLGIQDGMAAVVSWKKSLDPETDDATRQQIKDDLLVYCGQDTLLMHEMVMELQRLAN